MKTNVVSFVLVSSLLALAAWLVHAPNPGQADEVPDKYRATVAKGLEYLAKNQADDGHWEGDGGKHPVAMTGLVGLALFMERNTPGGLSSSNSLKPATYSANIRKASEWLMKKCETGRDGLIFSGHSSETTRYMEGQGLAVLFLAGVLRVESDAERRRKLTDTLTKAIKYMIKAQSTQGGWYHTSKTEGHDFDAVLPTAIQIQALQAAAHAGISVPVEVIRDGEQYLKASLARYEEGVKGENKVNRTVETAAAFAGCSRPMEVVSDLFGGQGPEVKKWLTFCQAEIPDGSNIKLGRDVLTHYYYAQALFNVGGEAWTSYRDATFDFLQDSQNKDGSWPSSEGISEGQVYATASWCIVLQIVHRSHPSVQPLPVSVL